MAPGCRKRRHSGMSGGDTWIMGSATGSMVNLENAVEDAIEAYTATYDANKNLATEVEVPTPDVSWRWAFEGNDDVKDTALGDAAAAGNAATITLTVKTTITQVD